MEFEKSTNPGGVWTEICQGNERWPIRTHAGLGSSRSPVSLTALLLLFIAQSKTVIKHIERQIIYSSP